MTMTAPRVPLFQRKGGSSAAPPATAGGKPGGVMISISHGKPSEENASAPDDGAMDDATCPNCGCVFDPATGDVKDDAGPDKMSADGGGDSGGGDLSSKLAAMMAQGGGNAQQ